MIKLFFLVFAFGYVLLQFLGCGKTCEQVSYNFSMAEQFFPEVDSIKIGDTLWVIAQHSVIFKDANSGNDISYSGSKLGLNIVASNLTDSANVASGNIGAFNSFNTVIVYGSAVGNDNLPDQNKGVNFEERNDSFLLKVAFIPKQKGVYGISLGNGAAVRKNHGCELAAFEIDNSNQNNHLYYYQNSRPGYVMSDYERTHLYCFKVY